MTVQPKRKVTLSATEMYDIILSPVITEKATKVSEHNQVTFRVRPEANKLEIKAAIEGVFGVKVTKVNTISLPGKTKIFKGRRGERSDRKKALVTLKSGQTIDISTGLPK